MSNSLSVVQEEVLSDLDGLAWWLAHRSSSHDHPILSVEDVHSELITAILVSFRHYENLARDEAVKVAKAAMRNRISDLWRSEQRPWNKQIVVLYLEDVQHEEPGVRSSSVNLMLEDLEASNDALKVAKLLINGSSTLDFQFWLANERRKHVYRGGRFKLRVKPFMIARALGMTVTEVRLAISELKEQAV